MEMILFTKNLINRIRLIIHLQFLVHVVHVALKGIDVNA